MAAIDVTDESEWMKVNFDTGAAVTAIGKKYATGESGNGVNYRTATGEYVEDQGPAIIAGTDEYGIVRRLRGRAVEVHKTLACASQLISKGQDCFLYDDGGWLMPSGSELAQKIRKLVEEYSARNYTPGLLPMYVENGVYNFYLQVPVEKMMSPLEGDAPISGGSRQAKEKP